MNRFLTAALAGSAAFCLSGCAYWPFSAIHKWWVASNEPEVKIYKPKMNAPENGKVREGKPEQKNTELSVENLERLSEAGNPNAQVALGKIYFDGAADTEKDLDRAFELFLAAAEKKNPQGMYNTAICYDGGFGTKQNLEEALKWYNRAAEAKVPEAMNKIVSVAEGRGDYLQALKYLRLLGDGGDPVCLRKAAVLLLNGFGQPTTPDEPFQRLLQASQLGDTRAQIHLADCYQRGHFTRVDYEEMFSWLTIAAQSGDPEGQTKLAYCYQKGLGTSKNSDVAVQWYTQAANANYPAAQSALGDCFFEGRGVRRDPKKAIELYKKAADNKDYLAQYRLARLYFEGIGVHESLEEAVRYFKLAADQDFPPALVQLGIFQQDGHAMPRNLEEAFSCYRRAAELQDTNGMIRLALCHLNGIGTPKDREEAAKWLNTAAIHGSAQAAELIRKHGLTSVNGTPSP